MSIADAVILRRFRIDIVDLATDGTRSSSGQPLHQLIPRHIDLDRLDLEPLLFCQTLKLFGLDRSPRVSVEDKPVLTVTARCPLSHHPVCDLV
jgi:hypothetical protein